MLSVSIQILLNLAPPVTLFVPSKGLLNIVRGVTSLVAEATLSLIQANVFCQ
nr:MAG TPA: hypothetical protein [Caudoviricetes sp.]